MAQPGYPLLELRVGGTDLKLMSGRLKTLLYVQSLFVPIRCWISCGDPAWDYFDGFYEKDAEVTLRFGVKTEEEEIWSGEKYLGVSSVRSSFHPDRLMVSIGLVSQVSGMNSVCSQKIFTDKKISAMVEELAGESSVDTQTETTKGELSLTQGGLTNGAFIRSVLAPLAFSSSRYDYFCYTRDGKTIVFEPPDLESEKAEFVFPGISENFASAGILDVYYGGASGISSLVGQAIDPLKKEASFFTAGDDSVDYKKLASKKPTAAENPSGVINFSAPVRDDFKDPEVEDLTKAVWSARMRNLWMVHLKSSLSPEMEIGDVVKLTVTGRDGEKHFTSGKYLLGAVIHWIDTQRANAYTRFWLIRRTTEQ